MALFAVEANPRRRPAAMLKNFDGHISTMVHWIHFVFGSAVWLVISGARKDRAFKFYTDLWGLFGQTNTKKLYAGGPYDH